MQETGLIFQNLYAGLKQTRVIAMTGITHGGMVGARPGEQQPHINTPCSRTAQRTTHAPGRQEVRRGQPDPLFCAVDRAHQRLQDIAMLMCIRVSHAPHTLPFVRHLGQSRKSKVCR